MTGHPHTSHHAPHRVVAVFTDPHEADDAVDELHIAGVPPAAIEEDHPGTSLAAPVDAEPIRTPPTSARHGHGLPRGWVAGTVVGSTSGVAIGAFLALMAGLPWLITLVVTLLAGGMIGLVLGSALGTMVSDQSQLRAAYDPGFVPPRRPATTVGVSVESQRMLRIARTILQRHHPVRVSVRQ